MKRTHFSQNGNALFIVLIAIILFAALAMVMSKTNNSVKNIENSENYIAANELLDYLSNVKKAVHTMMLMNGTSDITVSFEDDRPNQTGTSSDTTNTMNPNSRGTIDQVFNTVDGGMIQWKDFGHLTQNHSTSVDLYNQGYTGGNIVENVGTGEADLIFQLRDISLELCQIINKKAGLPYEEATIPLDTTFSNAHFKGAYNTNTLENVDGSEFGCFIRSTSPNMYFFYYVIIAR